MSLKSLLLLIPAGYAGYKLSKHYSDHKKADKMVDAASEDSFPASAPPAY